LKVDTRKALLQSARKAFAERGYAATSLEDLARTLGMTKAAVYHHFPSKRALLEALLEEGASEAEKALSSPGPLYDRLLAVGMAYRNQVEPLSAVITSQSGRRGSDQEAVRLAEAAMKQGLQKVGGLLEQVCPNHGQALAVVFASIVHGIYMIAGHLPGYPLEPLLQEGIGVFVRGLPKA
ncbi:MAG: helix-turn-helix domain-containing protein, partial [Meiothermus sp.]|nr:helix-turn-helix domain-containing protein [Meiothermus sp.]